MKPNSFHGPSILDWAKTISIRFLKVFVFTFQQSQSQNSLLEQLHQLVHNFFHFAHLKSTFFILHTYFYKTPTSVCLFYTFIQIKYSFLYPHSHRPTLVSHRNPHNPPATNPANQKNKPSNKIDAPGINITQQHNPHNPTTRNQNKPSNIIHTTHINRRLALSNKIDASDGDGENKKQDRCLQRQAMAMAMAMAMARDIQPETH